MTMAGGTAASMPTGAAEARPMGEIIAEILDGLIGLAPLGLAQRTLVEDAAEASGTTCWAAYFPHLLCSSRPERRILFERLGDALLLYLLRSDRGRPELSLIFPPFPFDASALARAGERMATVNGDRTRTIEWVDETTALDVVRQGYAIRLRAAEFVYDQAAAAAAEGPAYKRLRRNLSTATRHPGLVMRPYAAEDLAPCLDLLRQWRARMMQRDIVPNGYRYTRRCLETALEFPQDRLRGEVAQVDGKVRGFAFGGPINRDWGSVFIVINDLGFSGLPYLLRHRLIGAFPDLRSFNDSTDNGRSGLQELKQAFRPVGMNAVYRGRA